MKHQQMLKTEEIISLIKETFSRKLSEELNLIKVSSPLIVLDGTGINDDLSGAERPVRFPIKALEDQNGVVVHSLAKWKRIRLEEFGIESGKGILTNMHALRPDEDYTAIHSIYVDQWDWEKRIDATDRKLSYLKDTVSKIYNALKETELDIQDAHPEIKAVLPNTIKFIHAEELLQRYTLLSSKERETEIAKEYGAVFIIGIGGLLSDGFPHDARAADYDDWSTQSESEFNGLNGDIILWNPVLKCAFEISSMGIRVDKVALLKQLKEKKCEERAKLQYHSMLLSDKLPECIGGGIGQSRVCMFILKKAHIGEVQVSIWPETERQRMDLAGIHLL